MFRSFTFAAALFCAASVASAATFTLNFRATDTSNSSVTAADLGLSSLPSVFSGAITFSDTAPVINQGGSTDQSQWASAGIVSPAYGADSIQINVGQLSQTFLASDTSTGIFMELTDRRTQGNDIFTFGINNFRTSTIPNIVPNWKIALFNISAGGAFTAGSVPTPNSPGSLLQVQNAGFTNTSGFILLINETTGSQRALTFNDVQFSQENNMPAPIPLPASAAFVLTGLFGFSVLRSRRKRSVV